MDVLGPPHDFFCECCEWWRKQQSLEARSAKMREVEEVEPNEYHSSQADGFSNGD